MYDFATAPLSISLIYEENLIFFFINVAVKNKGTSLNSTLAVLNFIRCADRGV